MFTCIFLLINKTVVLFGDVCSICIFVVGRMAFSGAALRDHSETAIYGLQSTYTGFSFPSKPLSHLNYTCQLGIDQVAGNIRQTSIVCTLGMASFYTYFSGESWKTKEGILKMMDAGMNVLLINLSMTPREICKEVIKCAREIEKESDYGRLLAIAMDMTAAPVRTGIFEGVRYQNQLHFLGTIL